MPRREWTSPLGRKVTKVTQNALINCFHTLTDSSQLVNREAITHSQLSHPNILPFLGTFYEALGSPPIIVSPFVEEGSLSDAIRDYSITSVYFIRVVSPNPIHLFIPCNTTLPLLSCVQIIGISRGVAYLHSLNPPIVHGAIHPVSLFGPTTVTSLMHTC